MKLYRDQQRADALEGLLRGARCKDLDRLYETARARTREQSLPDSGQPARAHSKAIKKWLSENEDNIQVFYLPSYSPVLNPDELLNADLNSALQGPLRLAPSLP